MADGTGRPKDWNHFQLELHRRWGNAEQALFDEYVSNPKTFTEIILRRKDSLSFDQRVALARADWPSIEIFNMLAEDRDLTVRTYLMKNKKVSEECKERALLFQINLDNAYNPEVINLFRATSPCLRKKHHGKIRDCIKSFKISRNIDRYLDEIFKNI